MSSARYIAAHSARYGTSDVMMSSALRPRWGCSYGAMASRQNAPSCDCVPPAAEGLSVMSRSFCSRCRATSCRAIKASSDTQLGPVPVVSGELRQVVRRRTSLAGFPLPALLEDQPEVVQKLALEADAVRAHPGREREAEVRAREPAWNQPDLEERLLQAPRRKPSPPLPDGLDVVQPAAGGGDQAELGLGAADDLLVPVGKPGARELPLHQGQVPRVGVAGSVDGDVVDGNHVASEHHRLQIEPAAIRQQARDSGEQVAIDLLLPPSSVLLWRAEVLERTKARDGVEPAEGIAVDLAHVEQMDVQTVAPAGRQLR